MSAPTPAPGDDRPREGYYPDPSIPGYVRYWNGASWVPGTSRPAPKDGEPLAPPPGARPSVEETGPHFFDEDPVEEPPATASQHGSRPEPATAWGADRSHQSGFAGDADQRVAWPGAAPGTDPRLPHARGTGPAGDAVAGAGPAAAGDGALGDPRAGGGGHATGGSAGADADAGAGAGAQAVGGVPSGAAGGGSAAGGSAGGAAGGGRPGDAGFAEGRSARGDDPRSARADAPAGPSAGAASGGEAEAGSGNTFVFRRPEAGARSAPATDGPGDDEGTMTFRAVPPRDAATGGPGFGAGKAAAARAAAAQAPAAATPTALSGPQRTGGPAGPRQAAAPHQAAAHQAGVPQAAPHQAATPHQGGAPQPAASPQQPAASAPVASGPGGGQASWAQQVHRLAGASGDEQPVAPWKPPVEDVFQAAARRQAAARPAGLGKRLAARLIDTVVLACVTGVAAVPLGIKGIDHVNGKIDEAKLSGETVTVWLLDGTTSTYLGIVLAVLLLFGVVYEALPTAKWGRTLGKKLLGLQVRDIEAHEPPSFGAALRRWLVYSVPGLLVVGVVGVAWCLFDRPWHQCWHDKASRTFVAG
ncbi:RDD family protein [Streptomyces sp. NPDC033538]|uniref:RDD family protein n=1 Tax=Streptomyces sp. NPDC033538 TaxID=3155367 RepID=UPI00340F55CE